MEKDGHSRVKAVIAIGSAALAADTPGDTVDTVGFDSLEYIINVGTAFVGGGFDITIEESDVDSGPTFVDVPADETLGVLPVIVATDTDLALRVGSIGKKRFQRLKLTETGTISAGVVGVTAVLSAARHMAVPDQST